MSSEQRLALVVSHDSDTCRTRRAPVRTIRRGQETRSPEEEEEEEEEEDGRSTCGQLSKRRSEPHGSVNPAEVMAAAGGSLARGRLHRIHTTRDRNMASAHFFSH
ncbi:unnamed protein product [Pleuronectes platessa]|uniref:Uncharacterized protein n=1 Tax=Pleuronectes platessa TaxID=8262 RepID=A0A9N7UVV6_PLEPL|nr:unnamed protein product [Pleuronectes platessa]